jgi:hypothetical protein
MIDALQLDDLKNRTAQTKCKMQNANALSSPNTVDIILSGWLSLLSLRFRHIQIIPSIYSSIYYQEDKMGG